MSKDEAKELILRAASFFKAQNAGYQSWGEVRVLQIGVRINGNEFLLTKENILLDAITAEDILLNPSKGIFNEIFSKRKDTGVILITQQRYASKVKKEIPPILDDQAQLLGVTIRIASSGSGIFKALKNRYAAILPDGKSICLGSNMEEAFVAAQLLEKTSKAFIEAEVLGGAKSINKIEAWLMQKFYQLKYSKEAKKNV